MADTDLFMECEEEELEPWQLIEDDVVDDTGGGMLLSATNISTGIKPGFALASIGDLQNNEAGKKAMLTVLSSNNNAGAPVMNSGGQPLIVAQNPSGLGSQMTVSSMYQPTTVQVLQDPKTGATSTVSGQPILITTQGFTVKDLRSVQNPVGIVLNVQGGQGTAPYQTKPLTLVPGMWSNGPGTSQSQEQQQCGHNPDQIQPLSPQAPQSEELQQESEDTDRINRKRPPLTEQQRRRQCERQQACRLRKRLARLRAEHPQEHDPQRLLELARCAQKRGPASDAERRRERGRQRQRACRLRKRAVKCEQEQQGGVQAQKRAPLSEEEQRRRWRERARAYRLRHRPAQIPAEHLHERAPQPRELQQQCGHNLGQIQLLSPQSPQSEEQQAQRDHNRGQIQLVSSPGPESEEQQQQSRKQIDRWIRKRLPLTEEQRRQRGRERQRACRLRKRMALAQAENPQEHDPQRLLELAQRLRKRAPLSEAERRWQQCKRTRAYRLRKRAAQFEQQRERERLRLAEQVQEYERLCLSEPTQCLQKRAALTEEQRRQRGRERTQAWRLRKRVSQIQAAHPEECDPQRLLELAQRSKMRPAPSAEQRRRQQCERTRAYRLRMRMARIRAELQQEGDPQRLIELAQRSRRRASLSEEERRQRRRKQMRESKRACRLRKRIAQVQAENPQERDPQRLLELAQSFQKRALASQEDQLQWVQHSVQQIQPLAPGASQSREQQQCACNLGQIQPLSPQGSQYIEQQQQSDHNLEIIQPISPQGPPYAEQPKQSDHNLVPIQRLSPQGPPYAEQQQQSDHNLVPIQHLSPQGPPYAEQQQQSDHNLVPIQHLSPQGPPYAEQQQQSDHNLVPIQHLSPQGPPYAEQQQQSDHNLVPIQRASPQGPPYAEQQQQSDHNLVPIQLPSPQDPLYLEQQQSDHNLVPIQHLSPQGPPYAEQQQQSDHNLVPIQHLSPQGPPYAEQQQQSDHNPVPIQRASPQGPPYAEQQQQSDHNLVPIQLPSPQDPLYLEQQQSDHNLGQIQPLSPRVLESEEQQQNSERADQGIQKCVLLTEEQQHGKGKRTRGARLQKRASQFAKEQQQECDDQPLAEQAQQIQKCECPTAEQRGREHNEAWHLRMRIAEILAKHPEKFDPQRLLKLAQYIPRRLRNPRPLSLEEHRRQGRERQRAWRLRKRAAEVLAEQVQDHDPQHLHELAQCIQKRIEDRRRRQRERQRSCRLGKSTAERERERLRLAEAAQERQRLYLAEEAQKRSASLIKEQRRLRGCERQRAYRLRKRLGQVRLEHRQETESQRCHDLVRRSQNAAPTSREDLPQRVQHSVQQIQPLVPGASQSQEQQQCHRNPGQIQRLSPRGPESEEQQQLCEHHPGHNQPLSTQQSESEEQQKNSEHIDQEVQEGGLLTKDQQQNRSAQASHLQVEKECNQELKDWPLAEQTQQMQKHARLTRGWGYERTEAWRLRMRIAKIHAEHPEERDPQRLLKLAQCVPKRVRNPKPLSLEEHRRQGRERQRAWRLRKRAAEHVAELVQEHDPQHLHELAQSVQKRIEEERRQQRERQRSCRLRKQMAQLQRKKLQERDPQRIPKLGQCSQKRATLSEEDRRRHQPMRDSKRACLSRIQASLSEEEQPQPVQRSTQQIRPLLPPTSQSAEQQHVAELRVRQIHHIQGHASQSQEEQQRHDRRCWAVTPQVQHLPRGAPQQREGNPRQIRPPLPPSQEQEQAQWRLARLSLRQIQRLRKRAHQSREEQQLDRERRCLAEKTRHHRPLAPPSHEPRRQQQPATQFVKSAVGVPQLWSPVTSIRPATSTFPGSVTTVIPATVTIRSTVPPVPQKSTTQTSPTQSHLHPKSLAQPMASPPPPQPHVQAQSQPQPRPQVHAQSQPNMLHHPHTLQLANHDHKLVNFLQNTNLIRLKAADSTNPEIRPKPEEVVKSSILPPVQITTTTTAAPQITHKNTLNNTTPFKLPESNINNGVPIPKDCPKCNIHFNIMESLKVHMAYCCPQLLNSSTPAKNPQHQPHPPPPPPPPPPPAPTPQQQQPVKLAEPIQAKLIMLVDDFYYGRDEGSTYQMLHEMKTSTTFRCLSCLKRLKNNIRFMNHMKHHLELEQQNDESIENHTTCQHCFRQYATPFQLQCHIENVHSPYETTTKCKICELAFETEQLFLQHMKDTHKPGEMPYVCQVCEYRSSVYLEVDNHFRMIHEDTKNLLCPYCLKVLKNSSAYQQHYMKHQKKSVYPCNKCRLQFISAKEKMEHKVEHHKTFKKPKQLEGLQPGTKVTIRTSMGQARAAGGSSQEAPTRKVYPPVLPAKAQEPPACSTVHTVASVAKPAPKPVKKKSVERMSMLLIDMQEIRQLYGNQVCLECNFDISNISNHFPTYVHCSRCRYSTSCSRAYADHMISYHTQRGKPKYLMFGKMKKSGILLACSSCTFTVDKGDGDEMAQHLDQNQEHGPCRFVTFTVERRGKGREVAEEPLRDSESWLGTADSKSEEEERGDVQKSSPEEERQPESPGPPICEVKNPVVKTQQIKTVRLSTVCSTDYINVKVSSRAPIASSQPVPKAASIDKDGSSPIYIEEEKEHSSPIYIEEEKEHSSPIYIEEEKGSSSPIYIEEESELPKGEDDSESQHEGSTSPRKSLSEHEFKVVLHALCCGMQAATEQYKKSRSQVEQWLNECAQHLDLLNVGSDDDAPLLSADAEEQLVEWVLVQRERQLPLTEETFLQKLSQLFSCEVPALADSCLWSVGFLLRHNLIAYAKITVARKLPKEMEENIQSFIEFAQRQISARDFPRCMIANMDEIPIFLDLESLSQPEATPGDLGVTGTGQPQFVIIFTILADGNLLPTMIFSRGGLPSWLKVPNGILLEVKENGHSEAEVLKLWLAKVWQRHMTMQYDKSMLLLDSFRMHMSDDFIDDLSRCNSLPLVIPGGCTSRIQPLDMCISQTFRNFLQKRWAEYVKEAKCYRDVYGDVLQSLLNWVAEAIEFVGANADIVQQSFLVASVLPGPSGTPTSVQQKVEVQEELVSFLQEQLELSGKFEERDDLGDVPAIAFDPKLLTKLFEADSDTESFYGFHENDL